ncbi:MAG: response regulator [Acidobacteriota bacterium]
MVRVFIADDHPIVRDGLKRLIEGEEQLAVVGEASTCAATLREAPESGADVLILDLNMPGRGGLDTLRQLKEVDPDLGVLVLSIHPPEEFGVRAIRAGAAGYLHKEAAGDELTEAIKKVAGGERYISPVVAEQLAVHVGEDLPDKLHASLSEREFQVLRMLGEGKTVSEIADELALSVKTISTYRARILDKMRMDNNAQLIRYAVDHGLA